MIKIIDFLILYFVGVYCGRRKVPFNAPQPQTNKVWVEYVNGEDDEQGRFVLEWKEIQNGPGKYF